MLYYNVIRFLRLIDSTIIVNFILRFRIDMVSLGDRSAVMFERGSLIYTISEMLKVHRVQLFTSSH